MHCGLKHAKIYHMESGGVVKNFIRNSSIGAKIAIILFFVLVIVAIVFAILATKKPEEQNIDVTNFSEVSDAPKDYQTFTQELIWQLIEKNENIPDPSKYQAVIREGSYSEETDGNVVNANFIIDIEELRYSFEVDLAWPKNDRNKQTDLTVHIRCPYYTDVIYTDTKCVAETPETQIQRYLPHNYYLDSGDRVHIKFSNFGEPHLLVYINACKNQNLIDAAMNYAHDWIKSLYMDPDDFKMEPYDVCL